MKGKCHGGERGLGVAEWVIVRAQSRYSSSGAASMLGDSITTCSVYRHRSKSTSSVLLVGLLLLCFCGCGRQSSRTLMCHLTWLVFINNCCYAHLIPTAAWFCVQSPANKSKRKTYKVPAPKIQSGSGCGGHRFTLSCSCLLYTSPSPRDRTRSRMPSSA